MLMDPAPSAPVPELGAPVAHRLRFPGCSSTRAAAVFGLPESRRRSAASVPQESESKGTSMRINGLAIALLVVTGLTTASCAGSKELRMASSGDIPAAESTVKISTTSNGNTGFDLAVKHLAAPQRVDANTSVYVVWTRGSGSTDSTQNMGALVVDDNLNGSFAGVTPLKSFDLFVTAEPTQAAASPTGKTLLYTTVATQ